MSVRGNEKTATTARNHPAPWLLASIATFGIVAGATWFGGTVAQRHFMDVAQREYVAGTALAQLANGAIELQAALEGAMDGTDALTPEEAEDMVDALDRAFARYLASPVPLDERQRGDYAYTQYREWRNGYVMPAIAALRGGGPLVAPTMGVALRTQGLRENPSAGGPITQLAAASGERQRQTMERAAVTYNRTNAILTTFGLLGILGAMVAGSAAIARATGRDGHDLDAAAIAAEEAASWTFARADDGATAALATPARD
ncbi:MAG: hypothetical protein U0547_01755 [Dehalococcoidia bacterium]